MGFDQWQSSFDQLLGVKREPNSHELLLFKRAKKYIEKITWIPGVRMVAVVNSLSMFATHRDSDIDLFIITKKNRMWIARVLITFVFWMHGVWRHKKEISGNFCLSFWIEEGAMNIEKIAIKDDIYLYFWMYYMKPILVDDTIWDEFQERNKNYRFSTQALDFLKFKKGTVKESFFSRIFLHIANSFFRFYGEKKSKKSFLKKEKPEGVIIARDILKFHDRDRRKEIRFEILGR